MLKRVIPLIAALLLLSVAFSQTIFDIARTGTAAEMQAFLASGRNPNVLSGAGETPLMIAIRDNPEPLELVRVLLRAGADASLSTTREDALSLAMGRADDTIIAYLLMAGAGPYRGRIPAIPPAPAADDDGFIASTRGFTRADVDLREPFRFHAGTRLTAEDFIRACEVATRVELVRGIRNFHSGLLPSVTFSSTAEAPGRQQNAMLVYPITAEFLNPAGERVGTAYYCIGYVRNNILSLIVD